MICRSSGAAGIFCRDLPRTSSWANILPSLRDSSGSMPFIPSATCGTQVGQLRMTVLELAFAADFQGGHDQISGVSNLRLIQALAAICPDAPERRAPCSLMETCTRLSAAGVTPGMRLA